MGAVATLLAAGAFAYVLVARSQPAPTARPVAASSPTAPAPTTMTGKLAVVPTRATAFERPATVLPATTTDDKPTAVPVAAAAVAGSTSTTAEQRRNLASMGELVTSARWVFRVTKAYEQRTPRA
jgi:hypothetical protein